MVQIDLESLTKNELVRMAAEAGVSTWGTKRDLIDRLQGAQPPASNEPVGDVETRPVDVVIEQEPDDDPPPSPSPRLPCGCGPGETCGTHLPVPHGWPADAPPPDLEIPVPAPPIPPVVQLTEEIIDGGEDVDTGELRISRSKKECLVAFTVGTRGRVVNGRMTPATRLDLQARALTRAQDEGLPARAPRLARWTPTADGRGGVAVYSMIIKRG